MYPMSYVLLPMYLFSHLHADVSLCRFITSTGDDRGDLVSSMIHSLPGEIGSKLPLGAFDRLRYTCRIVAFPGHSILNTIFYLT